MEKMKKKILIVILLIIAGIILFYFIQPKSIEAPTTQENEGQTKAIEDQKEPEIPTLSIESIFDHKINTEGLDQSKIVRLIATGDVIPARGANWPAVTSGDFTYNWKKTAGFLKKGDITLINLETPLTKGCPLQTEGFTFCGNARHIEGIKFAGVDSVSIANNHIDNYGIIGRNETISILEKNKIGWSGFNNLDIQKVNGISFGFLSYNAVGNKLDIDTVKNEIKNSDKKVDVLVVSIHWGDEYVLVPRNYGNIAPDDPKDIGPQLIDAGADLIIGNHPHWVQGIQIIGSKLITYAHGNFIFDQTWSKETQEGVVGEYVFYLPDEAPTLPTGRSAKASEVRLIDVKFHPILVDISYQPKFLSKKDGQHILDRMLKSTMQIFPSP